MTASLPRLKPDPIPGVAPIPEHLADSELKAVYEETKTALQVPWMGVVTMSFARYPRFYASLWNGFRELSASGQFIAACRELRQEAEASGLRAGSIAPELRQRGYSEPELGDIRTLIEIFSHGNMPYLLMATAARLLLEGHEFGSGELLADPPQPHHGPAAGGKLVLMEYHHADQRLKEIYEEVKATVGLPFLNTDYRALARWPSYFDTAWQSLRGVIPGFAYETAVERVHNKAVALILGLPNPTGLTSAELIDAARQDGGPDNILAVVRLFQWLLPGLVVNIAYLQEQMRAA